MIIPENENCYEVVITVEALEDDTPVLLFSSRKYEFGFDKEQAALAIVALQQFIKTGGLPE